MCTATDAQRQTASCSTSVTVIDSNPGNGNHNGRPLATVKESPGQ